MLRIDDTIFSLDIIEKKFSCDLQHCRGVCCRYGDSGAPLTDDEVPILDDIYPVVKSFLRPDGISAIIEQGTSTIDIENDKVTPLIDNLDCAYSVFDGEILMCGIEKAWSEGKISFRKPLSCHLFPLRIKTIFRIHCCKLSGTLHLFRWQGKREMEMADICMNF